ncbi:MAG TPA: hypothetical protein VFW76_14335 [Ktedonobacterales bacterium]|nr:hypothetical protein [Ktedonobacterales bacterium]
MPTQFDLDNAHDDDISGLPGDARELYHRLEHDGAASRKIIAQINQRLQTRITQLSANQIAANQEPEAIATVSPAPAPRAIAITHRASRATAMRRWAPTLATVAVVIAFIAILSFYAGLRAGSPSLLQGPPVIHQTPPAIDLSGVPLTPVATPGPAARPLAQVVTALHRQGNCSPVAPSSYFHVGDVVWVFVMLKQPEAGHIISVRWFMNGTDINPPLAGKTTLILGDNNAGACFSLQYPTPGKGSVKVYWDRPANDAGDSSNDASLMATINFAVLPPGYGAPTPGSAGTSVPPDQIVSSRLRLS